MSTDPIHVHFLAQYQFYDVQMQTAHAFLDSKNVDRTDSQRQPYTLAERIAKMVGDLPAEAYPDEVPQNTQAPEESVSVWKPNAYPGFTFGEEDAS